MPHDKSPRNNGLTKDFFKTFKFEVKKKHFYLVFHSLLIKENSTPHKEKNLLN